VRQVHFLVDKDTKKNGNDNWDVLKR